MKTIFITLACFLVLTNNSNAQNRRSIEGENELNIVKTSISGKENVCPVEQNVQYLASTNVSGINYNRVEFKVGNAGVITNNNSNSYTIYNAGNSNSVNINWGNSNSSKSWVQATYYWTIAGVNFDSKAVTEVNIGIVETPTISGPLTVCSNNFSNFTVSSPTPLPAGAVLYDWSATNTNLNGNVTSQNNSITLKAVNTNPIVVTLKLVSGCPFSPLGYFYYSNSSSYTISRPSSAPFPPSYSPDLLVKSSLSDGKWQVTANFPNIGINYTWDITRVPFGGSSDHYTGVNAGSRTFLMKNNDIVYIAANTKNDCGSSEGNSYSYKMVNGVLVWNQLFRKKQ